MLRFFAVLEGRRSHLVRVSAKCSQVDMVAGNSGSRYFDEDLRPFYFFSLKLDGDYLAPLKS